MVALLMLAILIQQDDESTGPDDTLELWQRVPKRYEQLFVMVQGKDLEGFLALCKPKIRVCYFDYMQYPSITKRGYPTGGNILQAYSRIEKTIDRDTREPNERVELAELLNAFWETGPHLERRMYSPDRWKLDDPSTGPGKPFGLGVPDAYLGFVGRRGAGDYLKLLVDPNDLKHPVIGFVSMGWG